MAKVEVSKIEYEGLKRQAEAYRKFVAELFESIIRDPIDQVVEDFRKTGIYSKEFLSDLELGLKKSSWAKNEDKTS